MEEEKMLNYEEEVDIILSKYYLFKNSNCRSDKNTKEKEQYISSKNAI